MSKRASSRLMSNTESELKAVTLPARLTALARSNAVWLILWSAPMWTGIVGRIGRPNAFMDDYGAMACAGERAAAHQALYVANAQCPGFHSSSYVYPPWVAETFARLIGAVGLSPLFWAYVAIFVVSIVWLLWAAILRPLPFAKPRDRIPYMGFVSGNPPAHGNIAIIVYAAVIGAGLALGADSLPFAALVAGAAMVKPIYLTLMAMTAYAPAPLWRRGVLIAAAAIAPVAMSLLGGPDIQAWRTFTLDVVGHWPGGGFLEWLKDIGLTAPLVVGPLYLVYAALIFVSGFVVAEAGKLGRVGRLWLGAVAGVLMIPRLSAYDLLALAPGLLVAEDAVRRVAPKAARWLAVNGRAACAIAFAAAIFGGVVKFGHILSLVMLIGGLAAAAVVIWRHRQEFTAQAA
jgi:hypothetical protein